MIVVVEPHNAEKHADLLEQMFRMRARIFRDHLGWDVVVDDGKERDKYDEQSPVYILYTDEGGHRVKGSTRFLPTTAQPWWPISFPIRSRMRRASWRRQIWECTRFCLDENVWQKKKEEILLLRPCARRFGVISRYWRGSNRSSEISMRRRCICGGASVAKSRFWAPRRDMGVRSISACTPFPRRLSAGSRKS